MYFVEFVVIIACDTVMAVYVIAQLIVANHYRTCIYHIIIRIVI